MSDCGQEPRLETLAGHASCDDDAALRHGCRLMVPKEDHAFLLLWELVAREGYHLIVDDAAADHPDALGTPQRDELCAQVCRGNVIRMRSGLRARDAWYPVSHEIAEDRTDFQGHNQRLWREQLNILQRWCARLAEKAGGGR